MPHYPDRERTESAIAKTYYCSGDEARRVFERLKEAIDRSAFERFEGALDSREQEIDYDLVDGGTLDEIIEKWKGNDHVK